MLSESAFKKLAMLPGKYVLVVRSVHPFLPHRKHRALLSRAALF
jgi:hypothetical protein